MAKRDDRRLRIIELLEDDPTTTVEELKERMGVGIATIYRDLKAVNMTAGINKPKVDIAELSKLYYSGVPISAICRELNITKHLFYFYKDKYGLRSKYHTQDNTKAVEQQFGIALDDFGSLQTALSILYRNLGIEEPSSCHVARVKGKIVNAIYTGDTIQIKNIVKTYLDVVRRIVEGMDSEELSYAIDNKPVIITKIVNYRSSLFVVKGVEHYVIAKALYGDFEELEFIDVTALLNVTRELILAHFQVKENYDKIV